MADDLIWANASIPQADRVGRFILIDVLYIAFNVFFAPITAIIASFTNMQTLESTSDWIKDLTTKYPGCRSIIEGVLAPLAYNIAISLSPKILHFLLIQQGRISKSDIQIELMGKYSWFLFFQTSIIGVVFSSVLELVLVFFQNGSEAVFDRIRTTMPGKSLFFANIIYQRTFVGLMLVLIQPVVLAKLFFYKICIPLSQKTPRSELKFRQNPILVFPGIIFPEFLVFPFQITLAFMTITPLSVIPGLLFYGMAAFIFKHQFVYSYSLPNESGGMYWRKLSVHMIFGLLLNQIFTVIQFWNPGRVSVMPIFFMLLLIGITASFIPFLDRTFTPVCEILPLTDEDRRRKRGLTCDLVYKQGRLLQVLQPIETAPKIFAEIAADGGDAVEGWEIQGERHADMSEVISLASENGRRPAPRPLSPLSRGPTPSEAASIALPVIAAQSSIFEARKYEIVPLYLNLDGSIHTYDPFDLDYLVDRTHIDNPYDHPSMRDHSQVIMLPAKLPALLKLIFGNEDGTNGSATIDRKRDHSPIAMGESALTEPGNSPPTDMARV